MNETEPNCPVSEALENVADVIRCASASTGEERDQYFKAYEASFVMSAYEAKQAGDIHTERECLANAAVMRSLQSGEFGYWLKPKKLTDGPVRLIVQTVDDEANH